MATLPCNDYLLLKNSIEKNIWSHTACGYHGARLIFSHVTDAETVRELGGMAPSMPLCPPRQLKQQEPQLKVQNATWLVENYSLNDTDIFIIHKTPHGQVLQW